MRLRTVILPHPPQAGEGLPPLPRRRPNALLRRSMGSACLPMPCGKTKNTELMGLGANYAAVWRVPKAAVAYSLRSETAGTELRRAQSHAN